MNTRLLGRRVERAARTVRLTVPGVDGPGRDDPVTVQARLGHASIATTNIYLHHLGSAADRAGCSV